LELLVLERSLGCQGLGGGSCGFQLAFQLVFQLVDENDPPGRAGGTPSHVFGGLPRQPSRPLGRAWSPGRLKTVHLPKTAATSELEALVTKRQESGLGFAFPGPNGHLEPP